MFQFELTLEKIFIFDYFFIFNFVVINETFRNGVPEMPKKWIFQEGWTKYDRKTGKGVPVEYPEDDLLIFDIENCVVEGNFFKRSIFQTFWKLYVLLHQIF